MLSPPGIQNCTSVDIAVSMESTKRYIVYLGYSEVDFSTHLMMNLMTIDLIHLLLASQIVKLQ